MGRKNTRRRTHANLDELDRGLADWPDRGCAVWRHCLTCPLRRCVHEMPRVKIRPLGRAVRTYYRHRAGEPIAAILAAEQISERTFYRHLAAARAALAGPSPPR